MHIRALPLALLLAACAASARDKRGAPGADSAARAVQRTLPPAAFRVPSSGGPIAVYTLPDLDSTRYAAGSHVASARSAVGVDLVGRRLLYRDSAGAIASFDLVSLRERTVAPRGAMATIAADGSLLAVDARGAVTESQPWGTRAWASSLGRGVREVFAAPGPRLIVVRQAGGDSLAVTSRESGISSAIAVPEANGRAATNDGDAVAFATDSGVVVFQDRELDRPWRVRLAGRPRAVVFSPSGHRLYVALSERNELAVIDRFEREARSAIPLPGRAAALRMDPWGRVLLVRGEARGGEGEIWVVAPARNSVVGRLRADWATDLPTVSQEGVILSREGDAIVCRDARSLDSLSAVADGARDLWFTGRWGPTPVTAALRQAAAEERPAPAPPSGAAAPGPAPAARAPAGAPAPPGAAPAAPPGREGLGQPETPAAPGQFWVQVTSTRSESAARALANELSGERHPALVVPPRVEGDNWRVMSGPYRSREAADSAGRSLGRPFWVVDRSREDATRP